MKVGNGSLRFGGCSSTYLIPLEQYCPKLNVWIKSFAPDPNAMADFLLNILGDMFLFIETADLPSNLFQ